MVVNAEIRGDGVALLLRRQLPFDGVGKLWQWSRSIFTEGGGRHAAMSYLLVVAQLQVER
jgi:hypothetical protein